MANVLKGEEADRVVFAFQPKPIHVEATTVAKGFMRMQEETGSDFQIAEEVAEQSGIREMQQQAIDAKVEDTVLERLKDIQEQAYKQAYELGYAEGREKAFEDQRSELRARMERFDGLCSVVDTLVTRLSKEHETTLMKLVYEVSKRVAMREISLQQEPVLALLTELVQDVQGADSITIKLHPDDAKFIEEARVKDVKAAEELARVKIQASPEITSGGCLIETNYGAIDATVEERVARAWDAIRAKLPILSQKKGS